MASLYSAIAMSGPCVARKQARLSWAWAERGSSSMAFLNSLMASSSQPRSASSIPRELCSSERAMGSLSRLTAAESSRVRGAAHAGRLLPVDAAAAERASSIARPARTMAVYTPLTPEQLAFVTRAYGLAAPERAVAEPKGSINTNYHLWCGG